PLGPLVVAPSISYEETWLTNRLRRRWDAQNNKLDTFSHEKGFFTDRQMSFGISLNTALYGTANFKNSRLIALRHVMRPNVSFNYRPNLSRKNFDVVQVDSIGNRFTRYSHFAGANMFSGYSFGRYGGISFGVDNNLEMKVRSKKDTTAQGIKKVRLIDGFGFNSGYNYLADSLSPKLQPFNIYLRSSLFDKINLSATAVLDPYEMGADGIINYRRYVWQGNRFTPGRISNVSVSMSTDFRSKTRDGKEPEDETPGINNQPGITDPMLLGDQERLLEYMQMNPSQFVDFNIPWTVSVGFTLSLYRTYDRVKEQMVNNLNSNLNFSGSFSLTPKWNFSTNGYYDFNDMKLQMFSMSINREMHCWQMSINVAPVGNWRYFSFTISPKSSILQDLRINRTRQFTDF
ncbi:MAG: putative LPS assembly protein LptD, partial [Chitinophagaceae bacterium]